ncbi:MAG TPA: PAS domain-containing protein, partial [Bacteroidales bacterium]|nr:PAS domain-containing protein [Bacteroidales bacterium]
MLFQHSPLAYFEFNRFLRLSYINEQGIIFSGYRQDEKIYRLTDFVPVSGSLRKQWEVNSTGTHLTEVGLQGKNGIRLYLNCLWWIIDNKGTFDGIACLGFDSTRYHQMMEELQKSTSQFKEFAQLLPETVFEMDTDGNFLFLNESSFEVFGYSKGDRINAFDMFVPEELPRIKENMKRTLSGEKIKGNAYLAKRKDGSTFPVLIYSDIIYQGGKPIGFRGFVVDISHIRMAEKALLESEEKYRSLTNRLPVGIYRTNREGKLLYANPAFIHMLGYDSPEEAFAHPVQDFYSEPDEREKLLQPLEPGEEYYQPEIHLKKKDGTRIIVKDRGKVYKSPEGQIYYDGIIEDITETHLLEEKLKQAEKL